MIEGTSARTLNHTQWMGNLGADTG
jgi:hypothetical protein